MLLSVLLLHGGVVLLVLSHLKLVSRLDKRDLLLTLGALKVVHGLGQTLKLAFHILTLLDLLLDGILHEAALVELLALLELDLDLLALAALLRLGEEGEGLLLLLLLHLLANAGLFAETTFFFETLSLRSLVLALQGNTSLLGYPLLLLKDAFRLLLAALDDNLARKSKLVLNLNLGQQLSGVGLGRRSSSRRFIGVNHLDAVAQLLSHEHKVVLDAVALELVALEANALVLVVKTRRDSSALRAVNKNTLDLSEFQERHHLLKRLKLHGLINLGRLLQHADNGEVAHLRQELTEGERRDGTGRGELDGLSVHGSKHLLGMLAEVQGMEFLLKQSVQLAGLGGHEGQDTLGDELGKQRLAGEHLARITLGVEGVTEQGRHADVTFLGVLDLLVRSTRRCARFVGRDGDRGEQHRRSHSLQVLWCEVAVVSLAQVEELVPGVRVIEVILRHPEDLRELGVVRRHHPRVGRFLQDERQAVDVLNRAERLLPQLELRGGLELLEPGLEVVVLRLGQGHVRAITLVAVLLKVGQVVAQDLAETAELGGALVSHAEVKRAVGRHGVEPLQLVVVAQNLEDGTVRLPQELEPRGDELAVGAILVALGRD